MNIYQNELRAMMQGMSRGFAAHKFKSIPHVDLILNSVNDQLGLNLNDLSSPSHKRDVSEARFIAMKLIRDECKLSLKQIGSIFNRDHTTVLYALRTADDLQTNTAFLNKLSIVEEHLATQLL
jgi:chromosomal replication initiator protein